MAFYGNADEVRDDLSAGVRRGHQGYLDTADVTDDLVERGRRFAYRTINSLLEPTFSSSIVPWASGSEPGIIAECANTIAEWWIENKRILLIGTALPEEVNRFNTEYVECINRLKEIAKTGEGLGAVMPTETQAFFTHNNRTPTFDIDDALEWQRDPDRLDDIADERA